MRAEVARDLVNKFDNHFKNILDMIMIEAKQGRSILFCTTESDKRDKENYLSKEQIKKILDLGYNILNVSDFAEFDENNVNHGIWINLHLEVKIKGLEISHTNKYQANINRINHTSIFGKVSDGDIPDGYYRKPQDSPQEAYSAAFDYIKNNNLI